MNKLIDQYLTYLEYSKGRASRTVSKYRRYLEKLNIALTEVGLTIETADRVVLENFTGIQAHKDGLIPRARRPLVACVKGFYAWLFKSEIIQHDPAANLEYPKAGSRVPVPIALENAEKILMQCDLNTFVGVRDAAMLCLLIGGGMRISGLLGLNESDVSFVSDGNKEMLVVKVNEKGGKERLLPMRNEARLMLRAYLGHGELKKIDRNLDGGDKVLFVSTRNRRIPAHKYHGEARRLTPRAVNNILEAYGDAAGVPRDQLHSHAFRHLYGTELAEDNVNTLTIQALLGHADPRTTEIYTSLAMRQLSRIVNKSSPLGKIKTPVSGL